MTLRVKVTIASCLNRLELDPQFKFFALSGREGRRGSPLGGGGPCDLRSGLRGPRSVVLTRKAGDGLWKLACLHGTVLEAMAGLLSSLFPLLSLSRVVRLTGSTGADVWCPGWCWWTCECVVAPDQARVFGQFRVDPRPEGQ